MDTKKYTIIALLLCTLHLAVSCEKDSEQEEPEYEFKYDTYYSIYRLNNISPLEKNDTITVKLGDSIAVYMESEVDWKVLAEECSSIDITPKKNGGYLITTKQANFVTMGINSSSKSFLFYIDIQSIKSELTVLEPPTYQIDVKNEEIRSLIQNDLESSYAVKYLDYFKFTYLTNSGGSVSYVNRVLDNESEIGAFKDNGTNISMYFDNRLKYNFTFEEYDPSSLIYSHYLYQDLTDTFQSKYPAEQINKVLVIAECQKTNRK